MRIIVRVYDTWAAANKVITELESIGIPSEQIGVTATTQVDAKYSGKQTATEAALGTEIGASVGGGAGLLVGLGVLAIPGIGPVVAGGWLATVILGAISGAVAGGLIGSLVDEGIPKSEAELYLETVRRGGTMITAKVSDNLTARATEIMERFIPINVAARTAEYQEQGWRQFDPNAQPYDLAQPEIDRIRS